MNESVTPVISVVGKSDSGKTLVVAALVKQLKAHGYRVGVLKHSVHGVDFDVPGKDSWVHSQAGADISGVASGTTFSLNFSLGHEKTLDEIISAYYEDMDIVLTEGYKKSGKPKIEVSRKEISDELICNEDELIAVVTDNEFEIPVPVYGFDETAALADLIEERYLETRRHGD